MTMQGRPAEALDMNSAPTPAKATLRSRLGNLGDADLGSLRVLVVLAFIWAYFGIASPHFLTSVNLTNLTLQVAAVGVVSIGVVLLLLLGEIDLSVGAVSGLCAAIVAALSVQQGWPAYAAILAGLGAAALVGLLQGLIVTWFAIPSFVVTLAGFLGWAGVKLAVLGTAGTLSISDRAILVLANNFVPNWLSWTMAGVGVVVIVGHALWTHSRRSSAGLESESLVRALARPSIVSAVLLVTVAVLTRDRGVPVSLCILVALVIVFAGLISATRFGRHLMAVGGNQEASRRVGIPVRRVKVIVFMLASMLAAAGGILAMSRLTSVDQTAGSGNFLLYAIAGPVIAGVSLFGGRGSVWSALLGAVVIGSIQNGMNLLAYPASIQSIVTALVLLFAVILDALARRRRPRG